MCRCADVRSAIHRLFSPFLPSLFRKSKKAPRNFCCWWHCDTITIRITLVVVAEGCHHLPSASFVFACIRFASFCSWNCQGSLGHPPYVLVTWIICESQLSERYSAQVSRAVRKQLLREVGQQLNKMTKQKHNTFTTSEPASLDQWWSAHQRHHLTKETEKINSWRKQHRMVKFAPCHTHIKHHSTWYSSFMYISLLYTHHKTSTSGIEWSPLEWHLDHGTGHLVPFQTMVKQELAPEKHKQLVPCAGAKPSVTLQPCQGPKCLFWEKVSKSGNPKIPGNDKNLFFFATVRSH